MNREVLKGRLARDSSRTIEVSSIKKYTEISEKFGVERTRAARSTGIECRIRAVRLILQSMYELLYH